ncbi:MAG: N-acetylmuramoyl-L-alanine amidase [bacterium]
MPNVLIETAFLSNKREERLLKSTSFQEKIAKAIYESVKIFKEKYEGDWVRK